MDYLFKSQGSIVSPWVALSSIVVVLALLARLYSQWNESRAVEKLRAEHNCKDPPKLQYKWLLGVDVVVQAFVEDRDDNILGFFDQMFRQTGNTFEKDLLGSRSFDTIEPGVIEAVLSTNFADFSLGARPGIFRPLLGDGIFTQDGAAWKASREMLRPQFMRTRSEAFPAFQEVIETFVTELIDLPAASSSSSSALDLQPLFFRLTLDTALAVLFGEKPQSTVLGSKDANQSGDGDGTFAKAFDEAQHKLSERGRLGDFYYLLDSSAFRGACRKIHSFVDGIVARALAADKDKDTTDTDTKKSERYIFLEALMSKTKDPAVLRDHSINILLAGRDTTACLLSWTIYLLARDQKVQSRLREECVSLASYQGKDSAANSQYSDLPTATEIKGARYLNSVLTEVLRLYPSAPVNSRTALRTLVLPCGGGPDGTSPLLIRDGDAIGYSVYSMHRRKDLYGPDADIFRPERWEENDGELRQKIGWGYLPFNGGPRVCPGQEFALLEVGYAVVRLLQEFESVEAVEAEKGQGIEKGGKEVDVERKPRENVRLVVSIKEGCHVVLKAGYLSV